MIIYLSHMMVKYFSYGNIFEPCDDNILVPCDATIFEHVMIKHLRHMMVIYL